MKPVTASIGDANYATRIVVGDHVLVADEPLRLGGGDTGPAPYDLLLASLGACTAITLKMYAARKGWTPVSIDVDLAIERNEDAARIVRRLHIQGLGDDQRRRMAEIAERTPVTLTLKSGIAIDTSLA